jgi:hypothetical protein
MRVGGVAVFGDCSMPSSAEFIGGVMVLSNYQKNLYKSVVLGMS